MKTVTPRLRPFAVSTLLALCVVGALFLTDLSDLDSAAAQAVTATATGAVASGTPTSTRSAIESISPTSTTTVVIVATPTGTMVPTVTASSTPSATPTASATATPSTITTPPLVSPRPMGAASVNTAPSLTNDAVRSLGTINAGETSVELTVSEILASVGYADPDPGALPGMALVGGSGQGWQILSAGQTVWGGPFDAGNLSSSNYFIRDTVKIRYFAAGGQPSHTATLVFRAWDRTVYAEHETYTADPGGGNWHPYGTSGYVGGTGAFSTETASLTINVVMPPTATPTATPTPVAGNPTPEPATSYTAAVLADNPVGWWRLGEGSGSVARDYANAGEVSDVATLTGVTLAQPAALNGDPDTSALFTGLAGSYGQISHSADLAVTNSTPLTVEAWVNPSSTAEGTIFEKTSNTGGTFSVWTQYSGGKAQFWLGTEGIVWAKAVSASTIPTDAWTHLAFTYDGVSAMKIYVNGILDGVGSYNAGAAGANSAIAGLGYFHRSNSGFFPGKIDEVAFYRSALPSSRVAAHHLAGRAILVPGSQTVARDADRSIGGFDLVNPAGTAGAFTTRVQASHGTVTLGTVVGLSFTSGANGTSDFSFGATAADARAALNSLVYRGAPGWSGSDSLTITTDGGTGRNPAASVPITVSPNVPPAVRLSAVTSVRFDGVESAAGDYVAVPDHPDFDGGTAFTAEAWVKWEGPMGANGYRVVLSKTSIDSPPNTIQSGYSLLLYCDLPTFAVHIPGQLNDLVTAGSPVTEGEWTHIAGSWDGRYIKVYVNGVLAGTRDTGALRSMQPSATQFLMGREFINGLNERTFKGSVGEVRVWNTTRTEEQIAGNYSANLTGSEAGLVAAWRMNEGAGTTVADYTGHGHTGTFGPGANAPAWNTAAALALSYIENAGPAVVDGGLLAGDADGLNLAGATISISSGFSSGDVLGATTAGTSISASYDPATGVLSLLGSDTVGNYQQVLRSVTYRSSSDDPTDGGRYPSRAITVVVSDGIHDSLPATRSVVIRAVNDAPAMYAGPASLAGTDEDTTSPGTLVSSALGALSHADPDGPAGGIAVTDAMGNGTWQYSTDGVTWNGIGFVSDMASLLLSASSQLRYLPDGIRGETAYLSFRAWDQTSGTASTAVTRSLADTTTNGGSTAYSAVMAQAVLTVTAVNDAPIVTAPSSLLSAEDVAAPVTGVSFADVDAGSSSVAVTFSASQGTLGAVSGSGVTVAGSGTGTLVLAGSIANINAFIAASSVNYIPAPNSSEAATLTVSIDDGANSGAGGARTGTGTISVSITTVNDAPVASGQSATTDEDRPVAITLEASDPDGDPLTFIVVSGPSNGVLSSDGPNLTYTPRADFSGSDSFTFKVNDGTVDSAPATVSITVAPVNDAPVAADDSHIAIEDAELTVSAPGVLGNDTDAEGQSLSAVLAVGPGHGILTLNGDGSFGYLPEADFAGLDSFSYRACDGTVCSATATVTITASAVNDGPVLSLPGPQTVQQESLLVVPGVSVDDRDAGAGEIEVSLLVSHGSVTLGSLAGLTFISGANGSSSMTFVGGLPDVNAALAGLIYRSYGDFDGAELLAFTVSDLGNTGSGGVLTVSRILYITVTPAPGEDVAPRPSDPTPGSTPEPVAGTPEAPPAPPATPVSTATPAPSATPSPVLVVVTPAPTVPVTPVTANVPAGIPAFGGDGLIGIVGGETRGVGVITATPAAWGGASVEIRVDNEGASRAVVFEPAASPTAEPRLSGGTTITRSFSLEVYNYDEDSNSATHRSDEEKRQAAPVVLRLAVSQAELDSVGGDASRFALLRVSPEGGNDPVPSTFMRNDASDSPAGWLVATFVPRSTYLVVVLPVGEKATYGELRPDQQAWVEVAYTDGGRYFPETGYSVHNDAFWDYFRKRGGVRTFGYPVTREFSLDGYTVQIFQRAAMQEQPGGGVALINLLDGGPYALEDLSPAYPQADPELVSAAPSPADVEFGYLALRFVSEMVPDEWDGSRAGFLSAYMGAVSFENAYPDDNGSPDLLPLMNLEVWGLPTSRPVRDPANSDFVYQRFQRGILHHDANGGWTQGVLLGDEWKKTLVQRGILPAS